MQNPHHHMVNNFTATISQIALDDSNIQVLLRKRTTEEQAKNRFALTAVFDCVRLCGKQGIALRGHRDEKTTGNSWNLLWLVGRYNNDVNNYLKSKSKTKFMSADIQNEMLKILSQKILRKLISGIKDESRIFSNSLASRTTNNNSYIFSLIADETSDISNREQVSICIRYCTSSLESNEVFLGFFETHRTDSHTLFCLVKDALLRLGLDISCLRGQGYDGGSNMAGKINGLQQKMIQENPKALYFHCAGHQLNLVCQDACTEVCLVSHVITIVNKIVAFVKESPKRCSWFAAIQAASGESATCNLRPLCNTRWILRKDCIDAFLINYSNLMNFMEEMSGDLEVSGTIRSAAFAHLLNLEKFEMYFVLRLLQRLFCIIHPIHVKCQSRHATTGELNMWIQELASALSLELDNFGKELFVESKQQALSLKINLPVIPRVCHAVTDEEVQSFYTNVFKEVFEKAASSLLRRYQSRPLLMSNLLRRLVEDETMSRDDIEGASMFYGDWDSVDITRERQLLFARLKRMECPISIAEICKQLRENQAILDMAPNFVTALKTYIVLPVSTCEAERSFSSLRRLKTYLRSTITQQRLNDLTVLTTHRDETEALDLNEAVTEFVSRSQTRRNKFGVQVQ